MKFRRNKLTQIKREKVFISVLFKEITCQEYHQNEKSN